MKPLTQLESTLAWLINVPPPRLLETQKNFDPSHFIRTYYGRMAQWYAFSAVTAETRVQFPVSPMKYHVYTCVMMMITQ